MDGLPVSLLESMSVGCVPILANFSEGIRKVVSEDIGFVFPVGENILFAGAIALLSRDRNLLQRLSQNCIEKVKHEFDIRKQALLYYELYTNYRKYRKRHKIGLKDLGRLASYFDSYNKIKHFIRMAKSRLTHRTDLSAGQPS